MAVFPRRSRRCYKRSNDKIFANASDIVAKLRGNGSPTDEDVIKYFYSIVRNTAIDKLRKEKKHTDVIHDSKDEDEQLNMLATVPDPHNCSPEMQICLQQALEIFNNEHSVCADALNKQVLGATTKEIAAWRNANEGATRQYLSQCVKKLRELMNEHCPNSMRYA